MLIHTDQKPYQCDQCDQSFRQKQLLRRHQNLYHNPNYVPPPPREKTHECPECGRAFRHKGNLIRHMAVHDPESSAQEKALALKLGRQKKIQIIDGQQVEVMAGEEDDEDDDDTDGEMMAVEGQDGQQYVVLEVIQLQGSFVDLRLPSAAVKGVGIGHEHGGNAEGLEKDGDGGEQAVAVVTGDASHTMDQAVLHTAESDEEGLLADQHITPDSRIVINGRQGGRGWQSATDGAITMKLKYLTDEDDVMETLRHSRKLSRKDALAIRKRIETEKDMQNCFGFDDEGEDVDDDEAAKTTIQLLEAIH
ncbi:hypothetical protein C0J52_15857 [Blattella germanica]|nr:hypothetical protein C0J52_15857 [Blattella germanica]